MSEEIIPVDNLKIEELPYEQAFSTLEEIVSALEGGDQTLEKSLALYERGQLLVKHCSKLLEDAELKINQLAGNSEIPFEA